MTTGERGLAAFGERIEAWAAGRVRARAEERAAELLARHGPGHEAVFTDLPDGGVRVGIRKVDAHPPAVTPPPG